MNATEFNRHQTPSGGWAFRQPQTGWTAPTPIASTFSQTVRLIVAHRMANPAITAKHKLATNPAAVEIELETYTRKRLGLPEANQVPFLGSHSSYVARAVDAVADSTVGLKRAAQGTAVVIDWLASGGAAVAQELANKRASVCVTCPKNVAGAWYTTAPAELIKKTLEARQDLKLETPHDATLKSCDVCRCLMRLKVWCPLEFILSKTKPEVFSEFPGHCWIAKRDQ
jgi:hypothetical protein